MLKSIGKIPVEVAAGKTLTVNNSLTFSGTDGTTMTFPNTNATIARTDSSQTFSGQQTIQNSNNAVQCLSLQSKASGDVGQQQLIITKFDNDSTTSQVFVRFTIADNTAANGQINANGASQVAFGSWSDRRLKENIVDLPPQLSNIMALRPVEFDYIESEGGGHQISFIAQDFEQIYPDAVGERKDGMKTITGWGKTEARIVKAMQEQQAIIDALIDRVALLESQIQSLK